MKPVQTKLKTSSNLTTDGAAGVAGSFYKQPSKSAQGAVATLPSNSSTSNGVPAKKPAISVRGKCVAHTEGRFRVEVSYHAELIAVFKSIPSKNYGKCMAMHLYCFCRHLVPLTLVHPYGGLSDTSYTH